MFQYQGIMHALRGLFELVRPALFLGILLVIGSTGYRFIENWNLIDSIFMTVITITTVGFGEVNPLSSGGKLFTILLILGGVVFYGLALDGLLKAFVGNRFKHFMEEARMRDRTKKLKNHYVICGGGRMALAMIRELDRNHVPFVVLEMNSDSLVSRLNNLEKNEWLVLERDALVEESLIEARIEYAVGIATVLPTDADNLFVVLSARRLNGKLRIETRIAKESTRDKMLQAGADKVVSPYAVGGMQMARSLLFPDVDDFMEIALNKANYEFPMRVHNVATGDQYDGKRLRNSGIRKTGFIIISIKQPDGKLIFAPDPDTILTDGMELLMLGSGKERPLD